MSFEHFGLLPRLVAALNDAGIDQPTPIQEKAIPLGMEGRDVMGLAQTGTGKTAAFGLPLLDALMRKGKKPGPGMVHGLILAPTRELAKQIQDALSVFTQGSHIKVGLVVGGASINTQINRLKRGTDLLIATPGRLIDHLQRKTVDLRDAEFLVLDEADQMLDLGFIHALRQIAPLLPKNRQTMLFSATMPKNMEEIAGSYLNDPVRVQVNPPGKAADKIDQKLYFMPQSEKTHALIRHLGQHPEEMSLVFARTKYGAEKLMKTLVKAGFAAVSVHGNKSQGQRERAISAFKTGEATVLVATDVAARGLDIPGVMYVYNYELPNTPDNYVHRIGRTARAGRDGTAVAFCADHEMGLLKDIEKTMKTGIPVAGGDPWTAAAVAQPKRKKHRPGARRDRNGEGFDAAEAPSGKPAGGPRRNGGNPGGGRPNRGGKPGGGRPQGGGGKPKSGGGNRKPKQARG